MRILQRITILLFVAALVLFSAITVYDRVLLDHTSPVIQCDSDLLDVSVNATDEELLQGVTASDDRDGSLTDSILVKGVTQLLTDNTAKITYIVFDSSDNMATCQRTLRYTDYERPHFALSKPLIYRLGADIMLLDRLSAADSSDKDISDSIRVISQNISEYNAGVYSVTVQVTNRMGDTETLTLPVIVSNTAYNHQLIQLKEYLVYINAGDDFKPINNIAAVQEADGSPVSRNQVIIEGGVDTETPGTYEVSYTYDTFTVYLTVVVI